MTRIEILKEMLSDGVNTPLDAVAEMELSIYEGVMEMNKDHSSTQLHMFYRRLGESFVRLEKHIQTMEAKREVEMGSLRQLVQSQETKLRSLEGPCEVYDCRLYYGHYGPCNIRRDA